MRIDTRDLGRTQYDATFRAMREFTAARTADTVDEIWLTEHDPVFTQGQAGKAEHVLMPGDIPVVQSDRGGQVTYHGPGQLVGYLMIDIRRAGLAPRALVTAIEQSIIELLASYEIIGKSRADAPGVYVDGAKVASLGLRIRKGCSYHGLALNVAMDLEPFTRINPCGLRGIEVTQLVDLGGPRSIEEVKAPLVERLRSHLNRDRAIAPTTRGADVSNNV
jgi:lipoyl(octanoyl) transferase